MAAAVEPEDTAEQLPHVSGVLRVFTVPTWVRHVDLLPVMSDQELFTPSEEESDSRGSHETPIRYKDYVGSSSEVKRHRMNVLVPVTWSRESIVRDKLFKGVLHRVDKCEKQIRSFESKLEESVSSTSVGSTPSRKKVQVPEEVRVRDWYMCNGFAGHTQCFFQGL